MPPAFPIQRENPHIPPTLQIDHAVNGRWWKTAAFLRVSLFLVTPGCQDARTLVSFWVLEESRADTAQAPESHAGWSPSETSSAGSSDRSGTNGWVSKRISLQAAINESVSFRLRIAPGEPLHRPSIQIHPFQGEASRIDPSAVQLFRLHEVEVDRFPGWHIRSILPARRVKRPLDVLVPLHAPVGGMPAALAAGETIDLWADLMVPKGTPAGTYRSQFTLLAAKQSLATIDVELHVWPFVLPDECGTLALASLSHRAFLDAYFANQSGGPSIPEVWSDDPRREELKALLLGSLRLLRNHRLTPAVTDLAPAMKVSARGDSTLDWSLFDSVVGPCMDGTAFYDRIPLAACPIPLPPSVSLEHLASDDRGVAPDYLRRYVRLVGLHFAEKGWLSRAYTATPGDTGWDPHLADQIRAFSQVVHSAAGGNIAVVSRLSPLDLAPRGWINYPTVDLADVVAAWCPPARFFDSGAMAAERDSGRKTWMTLDRPPFSGSIAVGVSSTFVRIIGWQALALGAEAVDLGEVNAWPRSRMGITLDDYVEFDPNTLILPGQLFGLAEPVATVRLKLLRRSMQDLAYVHLLNEHGLSTVTRAVLSSLVKSAGAAASETHFADAGPIGWVDDPDLFELARKVMAEELVASAYPDSREGSAKTFARQALWRRLRNATERLPVISDGVRVRLTPATSEPMVELNVAATVVNWTTSPAAGNCEVDESLGQEATVHLVEAFDAMQPGEIRGVKLQMNTPLRRFMTTPIQAIPFRVATRNGVTQHGELRAACVTAAPLGAPVVVDGDLSEWLPGTSNAATDFLLIAPAPVGDTATDMRTPSTQTLVLIRRDNSYVYVAFRCGNAAKPTDVRKTQKAVHYEDLIPLGEDLVEILIDPLNLGTRSPGDLFHIVVKRTGTDVAEKGVHLDPPCGGHEPWAVDLAVATQTNDDHWTAEVRIPLNAFGAAVQRNTIWGVNFTRFDAARQEYSTWSGAVGNAYDPRSLGNLYLP